MDLAWMINRLRAMTWQEIATRCGRAVRERLDIRFGAWPVDLTDHRLIHRPTPIGPTSAKIDLLPDMLALLGDTADRLCQGEEPIMGWGWQTVGAPPRWRVDPVTGIEAPSGYGMDLDYRDPTTFGEARRIWELSRLHRWVVLAWAHRAIPERNERDRLNREVLGWCQANPYPEGPNWTSGLDAAIRIMSVTRVWQAVGSELSTEAQAGLESIAMHAARFVYQHRSVGSSANNHLIGEAAALIIVADQWPRLAHTDRYRRVGWRTLHRELLRQIGADGWPLEQTLSYGYFVIDMVLEAIRSPSAEGHPLLEDILDRMRQLLDTLCYFEAIGDPPDIGDADEGKAMPAIDPISRRDAILSVATPALTRAEYPTCTPWGRLMRLMRLPETPIAPDPYRIKPETRVFEQGGAVMVNRDRLHLLMDVGPLGYPPLNAHGHDDLLQVLLWVDGRALLVDPGSPTYFEYPQRRTDARSAANHNTPRLIEHEACEQAGPFLWRREARIVDRSWQLKQTPAKISASHDGYRRLKPPVTIHRSVKIESECVEVDDRVESDHPYPAGLVWQFHPECTVTEADDGWFVKRGAVQLKLVVLADRPETEIQEAEVSPCFGQVLKAKRLSVRFTRSCVTRMTLEITYPT